MVCFRNNHKSADVTPIFKKDDRLLKINSRPVSILPTLSKIYEKILYMQIYAFFQGASGQKSGRNGNVRKYFASFVHCIKTMNIFTVFLDILANFL